MSQIFVDYNDQIIAEDTPIFTAKNRNFRYGDGLFETMRVVNGTLLFSNLHVQRLQKSMQVLKMTHPQLLTSNTLQEKVEKLCRINKISQSARVRLSIYRKDGGYYTPECSETNYLIEAEKYPETNFPINQRGLITTIYADMYKPSGILSNLKTSNSLVYVMAGLFKAKMNIDDTILFNEKGNICETSTSNLFLIKDGKIYTPSLQNGCIAGVMRAVVLSLLQQNNIPFEEGTLSSDFLQQADEAFTTNAIKGIQWIVGIGNKRYFNNTALTLSKLLNESIINHNI